MPNFKITKFCVLEKKVFVGFDHIWAWRPAWSCNINHLYKLFPLQIEAFFMKFGFDWPSGFGDLSKWCRDGRTSEHVYTISSPCEPDGSGELKKSTIC